MKKLVITAFLFFLALFSNLALGNLGSQVLFAQETPDQKIQRLNSEIEKYQGEINKLKAQANTLANQIAQYDAQIKLTTLKITQVEEKIILLGGRIDQLETSLAALTNAFTIRARETYVMARMGDPVLLLVSAQDLSDAVSRFHYLKRIQEADRDLLFRLQTTQSSYVEEKDDQESLKQELEEQKANLATQKAAKDNLLKITRNDEKRYQELLAAARSELEAIQAIIAGKGTETQVGAVSQGSRIASIIQGASCNSSGQHLHFIVSQGGAVQNPFSFLKSGVAFDNCSGPYCGSPDGDPFNPSGSWDWPIVPTIDFSQGYGVTWAVRNTWVGSIYGFHNGIDIDSPSPEVRAVRSGVLYRGSYVGSGGCALRYVRVDHDENDIDTFYLHVNY
jgi:peptidoglycan hydrolase CwlO-like protein